MKTQYLRINEFAKLAGTTRQSLINWSNTGKFKEHHRTPGGHRIYTYDQLKELVGDIDEGKVEK